MLRLCIPCIGPEANLSQPRRPTTAFIRKHDNSYAGVPKRMGDHAPDLLIHLGLETERTQVFKVDTSPVVVDKRVLHLATNIRLSLAKQLFKARANLSEKKRSSSLSLSLFPRCLEDKFQLSLSLCLFFSPRSLVCLLTCSRALSVSV